MPDEIDERLRRDVDYRIGDLTRLLSKTQSLLASAKQHDDAWQLIAAGLIPHMDAAVQSLRAVTAATNVRHTSKVGLPLASLAAAAGTDETGLRELAATFLPSRHPECQELGWETLAHENYIWALGLNQGRPVHIAATGVVHVVAKSPVRARWFVDQLAAQADRSGIILDSTPPQGHREIIDFSHAIASKIEMVLSGKRQRRTLVAFNAPLDPAVAAQLEAQVRANANNALFVTVSAPPVTDGPFAAREGDVLIELEPAKDDVGVGVVKTYRASNDRLTLTETAAFLLQRPSKKKNTDA